LVEQVTSLGLTAMQSQPVRSDDQPLEMLVGGLHRVVMNRHTVASFRAVGQAAPPGADSRQAYEIQLAQGELYVEVVPGHPFVVNTPNARLQITGTKFSVRAAPGRTDLVLLRGSIRLGRSDGAGSAVDVTAGHASAVVGGRDPAAPTAVDAWGATAWARQLALANAIARTSLDSPSPMLGMLHDIQAGMSWPDLRSLDYRQWRDAHRRWFAREFPWLMGPGAPAGPGDGGDSDYITVLMASGAIWRFDYPLATGEPMGGLSAPAAPADQPYAAALQRWRSDVGALASVPPDRRGQVLLWSLRAGTYLANTRTAAWLSAREHPQEAVRLLAGQAPPVGGPSPPASADVQGWLDRLAQDVADCQAICQAAQELITLPSAQDCGDQATKLDAALAQAVAAMAGQAK